MTKFAKPMNIIQVFHSDKGDIVHDFYFPNTIIPVKFCLLIVHQANPDPFNKITHMHSPIYQYPAGNLSLGKVYCVNFENLKISGISYI